MLTEDLTPSAAILGVKQVKADALIPDRTYLFFSHTIKGQSENMELLDACLAKRVRLVDYECVRAAGQSSSPRLIAFGEFAGRAGLINGLRGLGLRMLALGHSSPFLAVAPTYAYQDYADACRGVARARRHVHTHAHATHTDGRTDTRTHARTDTRTGTAASARGHPSRSAAPRRVRGQARSPRWAIGCTRAACPRRLRRSSLASPARAT